jgi:voltage-gated potassium channel
VKKKFSHPVWGRLRYIVTLGALIDLFAILPFYIPIVLGTDLRFIRTLRLMLFSGFLNWEGICMLQK